MDLSTKDLLILATILLASLLVVRLLSTMTIFAFGLLLGLGLGVFLASFLDGNPSFDGGELALLKPRLSEMLNMFHR